MTATDIEAEERSRTVFFFFNAVRFRYFFLRSIYESINNFFVKLYFVFLFTQSYFFPVLEKVFDSPNWELKNKEREQKSYTKINKVGSKSVAALHKLTVHFQTFRVSLPCKNFNNSAGQKQQKIFLGWE